MLVYGILLLDLVQQSNIEETVRGFAMIYYSQNLLETIQIWSVPNIMTW